MPGLDPSWSAAGIDRLTQVVSTTVCPSSQVRDAIIASGMESGMRETMDQLELLVV
jgi:hypothetical protein